MNRLKLSVLLILGWLAFLKGRKIVNKSGNQNATNNDCHATANKMAETPFHQPTPPIHPSEEKWRVEQRGSWRKQNRPQWLLAATAIVTSAIGLITLNILQNTLELTREQLHRSQRPWVGIIDPVLITDPLMFDSKGAGLRVIFTLKNSGSSTAIKVHPIAMLEITEKFDVVLQGQAWGCQMPDTTSLPLAHLILPNQEKPFPMQIRREIATKDMGMKQAWLVGCLYYWDQFEKQHRTPFIYAFQTSEGKSTIKGNGTIAGKLIPFSASAYAS